MPNAKKQARNHLAQDCVAIASAKTIHSAFVMAGKSNLSRQGSFSTQSLLFPHLRQHTQ
jgi:hypothetical protein